MVEPDPHLVSDGAIFHYLWCTLLAMYVAICAITFIQIFRVWYHRCATRSVESRHGDGTPSLALPQPYMCHACSCGYHAALPFLHPIVTISSPPPPPPPTSIPAMLRLLTSYTTFPCPLLPNTLSSYPLSPSPLNVPPAINPGIASAPRPPIPGTSSFPSKAPSSSSASPGAPSAYASGSPTASSGPRGFRSLSTGRPTSCSSRPLPSS